LILEQLTLANFKNYEQAEFSFSAKINCFLGNNGVGKTNILDAIHYLSLCKSYFNSADNQNIRHNEQFFSIRGIFTDSSENKDQIFCGFKRQGGKIMRRNRKEYDRLADHIGFMPVVMVTPSDSSLITEGSEERRRLIDAIISQYDKRYLEDLILYNRVLLQRNKALKSFAFSGSFDIQMLEVYNEQLVDVGNKIFDKRKEFFDSFLPVFQKYYNFIAGTDELAKLEYQSQLNNTDFSTLLSQNINKDRALEYTSTGIHKDDMVLMLNDYPVKRIASQGQQKTYLVALKLAEFDFIEKHSTKKPILLLDDIFDKFDADRVKQIINLASDNHFGQIFITDTEPERIQKILAEISFDHKIFRINKNGDITSEKD
jgi:DNA replication and repair protein RecF